MKPIEFVIHDGDSTPNMPAYKLAEAMTKEMIVHGPDGKYEILSYYFSDGVMNLDVRRKDT